MMQLFFGQVRGQDRKEPVVDETAVLKKGLAGWVLQHKQSACIHDTATDGRWLNLGGQPYTVRSVLAVPVLRKGSILGLLTLTHPARHHFTEDKIQLMDIHQSETAMQERIQLNHGRTQVPCLTIDGKPMLESDDIIEYLENTF